ncbi:MAG: right-handed parallel beta-helix repeat-containing protein [Candidatus Bathyarchaeota archaeon]|nr:right-handed parallel beta-helix repeat-containing protein [Candidatus Bathyarchaeota archaeon]
MIKKKAFVFLSVLLLLCPAALAFQSVKVAQANFVGLYPPLDTLTINADGTLSPQIDAINQVGNVYTLTENITQYVLEVQRNNIVIDGAGYTIQRTLPTWSAQSAVALIGRTNVTVKNLHVDGLNRGVLLSSSYNCTISQNKFTNTQTGVALTDHATRNLVFGNVFVSGSGISIDNSTNNVLRNNSLTGKGPNLLVDCENATSAADFVNDIDYSNTVNGNPVCYWVNQHDRTVPADVGYVALINCTGISAWNLNLANNGQGVLLISTNRSTVANNNITFNDKGIALYNSQNNNILSNSIANNTHGIVTYSRPNTFTSNRLDNNTYDVNFEDRFIDEFDYSNIVDGTPICYWIWQTDKTVPVDVGYVVLLSCSNITVQNLNITDRRQAMLLMEVTNSTITRNIITNNQASIILKGASGNTISGNLIANNSDGVYMEAAKFNEVSGNKLNFNENFGIHLDDCSNNNFTRNYIAHSKQGFVVNRGGDNMVFENSVLYSREKGFHLGESFNNVLTGNNIAWTKTWALTISGTVGNNKIYHNNFINNMGGNSYQVYPGGDTLNKWDDGSEGNFWGAYESKYPTAHEVTEIGIYDAPVAINEINIDHYPLSKPVNMKYQLTILQPANTTYTSGRVPLSFFATANTSWTGYSLDGNTNVTLHEEEGTLLAGLSAGVHRLTVYAGDSNGGACASETIWFEVTGTGNPSATQPTGSSSNSLDQSTPSVEPQNAGSNFPSIGGGLGEFMWVAAAVAAFSLVALFVIKYRQNPRKYD